MKNIDKYISVFLTVAFTSVVFGQEPTLSELISLHAQDLKPIKNEIVNNIQNKFEDWAEHKR